MKRDMDLVRRILLKVEEAEAQLDINELLDDEHSQLEEIAYHVELMQAHGLLDANLIREMGGQVIAGRVSGLTWDGCDYLDAIRDDRVWTKTKKVIRETVGSTTMSVIKEVAVAVARGTILAALG